MPGDRLWRPGRGGFPDRSVDADRGGAVASRRGEWRHRRQWRDGGRGGDAHGGQAQIDISAGSANLGVFSSLARGVAGNGGAGSTGVGGAGGDGFGGQVNLNVTGTLTGTS